MESYDKLTDKEEEEKVTQIRNEFLDQLLKLVDGIILPDTRKYVIIFNTNHFDRLFEKTDMRFNALRDRFQRYEFKKIGKDEVIVYLKNISLKLLDYSIEPNTNNNSKKEIFQNIISKLNLKNENIFDNIPDDISISYRTLLKVLRKNCFNMLRTVEELQNTQNFDIFQDKSNNQIKN
ncbi:MAG: hypothetical protein Satyrvirus20_6 [Satyrvirus sp.]|uniref:Uncharacterized protein n=1 Tax=Satyrvirus sp. TaxID=2487771 RepID=A0A3G5AJ97_9VIRU|nr:MAG: hypothetical protein Satyrvirus20_6 [Satyrvirus sp.]